MRPAPQPFDASEQTASARFILKPGSCEICRSTPLCIEAVEYYKYFALRRRFYKRASDLATWRSFLSSNVPHSSLVLNLFGSCLLNYSRCMERNAAVEKKISQTSRTTLRRLPKRGSHDREVINAILDEGFICHVGFVVDGRPFVIPTGYARVENHLLIHGSQASRMLRTLGEGVDVCITVTLLDGLVLARSAFHHSMNYRSVVTFGRATLVEDRVEKISALLALSEHIIPGRWQDVREPTESELRQTTVLSLPIDEASAKIRTGPPLDDEEDYEMDVWAGVMPLRIVAGQPIADPRLPPEIAPPDYVINYRRTKA
jgi:uncharacterized protein